MMEKTCVFMGETGEWDSKSFSTELLFMSLRMPAVHNLLGQLLGHGDTQLSYMAQQPHNAHT